jgi:hypothetical protein
MKSSYAFKRALYLCFFFLISLYTCTTSEKDADHDGIPDTKDSCKMIAAKVQRRLPDCTENREGSTVCRNFRQHGWIFQE